ncbi:nitric oxide synthase oxygenase [Halalkalibacter wakoensis JCM 9140]|uniref:Nitric oxide synthase oxygenase n=1 Tax=Halalkalibacter wakoensis JCM 9140 TaxID=1236970 RepID=W4Q2G2_9BACI|nr:nitric oxide synthase oxygenase [Halalkalibacter wakoensis JCM 9140]
MLELEAKTFLQTRYQELGKSSDEYEKRLDEVYEEIKATGTYIHTYEELAHGARMAWRNSNRCIGRLFWESMHVLDERSLTTEEEIADALFFISNMGQIKGKSFRPLRFLSQVLYEY